MTDSAANPLLPYAAPASHDLRLILYGLRRMAVGGIGDAHAAHAFFVTQGLHYRRPLVLLRALVVEIARTGAARLAIGPCCCPRMSASERALLRVLALADTAPAQAHDVLAEVLRVSDCSQVLAHATAMSACFADLGRPLRMTEPALI